MRTWGLPGSLALLVLSLVLALPGHPAAGQSVKNTGTYILVGFDDWDTLDPGWSYDTASHSVIFNIYETLVAYAPAMAYNRLYPGRIEPRLSTKVPTVQNGLISPDGLSYTFPVREGVKFHDGSLMSAEDVAYSLRRFLVVDRAGGPSSLLLEPILGIPSTRDEAGKLRLTFTDLQRAIRVQGNNVVIRLKRPFGPFLDVMATRSYILPKAWAIANGDWDGTAQTMARWNNAEKSTLAFHDKANGTGPFTLQRLDRAPSRGCLVVCQEVVLARNEQYWRRPASLDRVVIRSIADPAIRLRMLRDGDADSAIITQREVAQAQESDGVEILNDLPSISTDPVMLFTMRIAAQGNSFLGSGQLDGSGIPPNFFSDVHVRRGFAYGFDYQRFYQEAVLNKGTVATGFIPPTVLQMSPRAATFTFDRAKAIKEFQAAWNGEVWRRGLMATAQWMP